MGHQANILPKEGHVTHSCRGTLKTVWVILQNCCCGKEGSWGVYSHWLEAAPGACKFPDTSRLSEGTGTEGPAAWGSLSLCWKIFNCWLLRAAVGALLFFPDDSPPQLRSKALIPQCNPSQEVPLARGAGLPKVTAPACNGGFTWGYKIWALASYVHLWRAIPTPELPATTLWVSPFSDPSCLPHCYLPSKPPAHNSFLSDSVSWESKFCSGEKAPGNQCGQNSKGIWRDVGGAHSLHQPPWCMMGTAEITLRC